jgi:hypothetical protein
MDIYCILCIDFQPVRVLTLCGISQLRPSHTAHHNMRCSGLNRGRMKKISDSFYKLLSCTMPHQKTEDRGRQGMVIQCEGYRCVVWMRVDG